MKGGSKFQGTQIQSILCCSHNKGSTSPAIHILEAERLILLHCGTIFVNVAEKRMPQSNNSIFMNSGTPKAIKSFHTGPSREVTFPLIPLHSYFTVLFRKRGRRGQQSFSRLRVLSLIFQRCQRGPISISLGCTSAL